MANDFGTVQTATLVTQSILRKLRFKLPMLFNVAHRFEPLLKHGQAGIVHDVGEGDTGDITPATGYPTTETSRTDTAVTVTANKWKYYAQTWDGSDLHAADRNLVEEEGDRGAYVLAKVVVDDVLNTLLPTYTNVTTTSAAATDFDVADCRAIRKALVERGCQGPFFGLLNADGWEGLTGDSVVIAAENNDAPNAVVQGSEVSRVSNISWSEYAGLPVIAGNTYGYAAQRDSMVIMAGAPDDVSEMFPDVPVANWRTNVETDPETGLSMRWAFSVDPLAQAARIFYSIRYGFSIGQDDSMEVIKSTS